MLSEARGMKEELGARFLRFLSMLEKIGLKLQPGGLKIGLRKDFLSGKTKREAGIPPGDFLD